MKSKLCLFFISILFSNSVLLNGAAKESLIVGTKIAEPFVIKTEEGKWTGVAFNLWEKIADELKLDYQIKEYDLEGLIEAVSKGEVDIGISPMTITAEREKLLDFSHPYFITGLSIAIPVKDESTVFTVVKGFLSTEFLESVLLLILLLTIVGALTWLFERKNNKEQFGEGTTKGLLSGFWWAAVTMTTVGYGDKAPKTLGGRVIGLIWMFTALIIISGITAAITSALTVNHLESQISSINDLRNSSVGTVHGSSSEAFLKNGRVVSKLYDTPIETLNALAKGEIDAVVYDAPILRYLIMTNNYTGKLKVLKTNLQQQHYGFSLPHESKIRENVNRALLVKINDHAWQDVIFNYFGE